MSGYHYKLIPTVPTYAPEAPAREAALERFKSFVPEAERVTAEVSEHVEFVNAMGNFGTVSCPVCGAVLDDDWWVNAMDAAYGESGFTDLGVIVLCCGAASLLREQSRRVARPGTVYRFSWAVVRSQRMLVFCHVGHEVEKIRPWRIH